MTFVELLQQKKEAIVQRWLDGALAAYPEESAAAFGRQKDPFGNPVGHRLRVGTRTIVEALLDGTDADDERIQQSLHEIIKIRAVQQFSASLAVGFVFLLKDAIRAELGDAVTGQRCLPDLTGFERRIDGVSLAAFDIFVECRERVSELRINEVKRRVSWAVEKMNQSGLEPVSDPANLAGGR